MSRADEIHELSDWLCLPTPQERYHYLTYHLELLTYERSLNALFNLFSDQPGEQSRLRVEQRILQDALVRGATLEAVRQAYINEYGGLVLGLPFRLEGIELLSITFPSLKDSARARSVAKLLLKDLIEYAQATHSAPAEVRAELQYRLGKLFAQDLPGQSAQFVTNVIAYYEAALLVYTRDRYPRQFAKVQVALGDVHRFKSPEDQLGALEQALPYYEAALEVYKGYNALINSYK